MYNECKVYWGIEEENQRWLNWLIISALNGRAKVGETATGWVEVYPQNWISDEVYKTQTFTVTIMAEGVQLEAFGSRSVVSWNEIGNDSLYAEHFVERAWNIFMN